MTILKAAITYFGAVFAVGFALGAIRTIWLVPAIGVRYAELLEMPFMFVAIVLAARWLDGRYLQSAAAAAHLVAGFAALALMLTAELTLVLGLQGLTLREYIATRDPVSGTVYALMLLLFALMPAILRQRPKHGG